MKITFSAPSKPRHGTIVVGVLEGLKLTQSAAALNKQSGGALNRAIKAGRFKGERGQSLVINAPSGVSANRICLFGIGKGKDIDELALQDAGGTICGLLNCVGESDVYVAIDAIEGCSIPTAQRAAQIGYGALLQSYRFDKYRTRQKAEQKPSLKHFTLMVSGSAVANKAFKPLQKTAEGVFFTRDLVSEPANVLYPETLAREAKTLEKLGVKVEIFTEAKLRKMGMGALLGVAQGSVRPPRVVVMQWRGNARAKDKRPLAFVGKGVTFDSGGISIKPSGGMEDMKWDMGGSAVVIGLMKALAGRKAKVNAVGIVGLVENMPSGSAQRPGDIVTSMSGQTIEVLNTDAEGRLVLADILWYCQERFKPKAMINLATLTGAIIVALGSEYAGLFSNNDGLASKLEAAGKSVAEKVWRFPLDPAYDKMLDCDIADMKNITNQRGAGSITAAQFLQRFVNKTPWAHLDIAGVTWDKKDKPTVPKGGTAFGVRLLDQLVSDHYEKG